MPVVTGHMGRTISQTQNTPLSNYTFLPADAWLGAPDGNEAWSSSNAYASAVNLVGDQFGFNIPTGSTIVKVRVRFNASRNSGGTTFELRNPDGSVIETLSGVVRNTYVTTTKTYTAEQLNDLNLRWVSQAGATDYAVLDGFIIEVEYLETTTPGNHKVTGRYPTEYLGFSPSSDGALTNGPYALGRPDGVQASYVQTSGSASSTTFGGLNLNLPADAYIKAVKLRWTAQGETKTASIELRSPGGTILGSVSGTPNNQYTMSASLTAEQLNSANIVFRNPVQYNVFTYLDAIDVQVEFIDFRELTKHQINLYGNERYPAQTDFFGTAGGTTYVNEGKYLGAPDGVTAMIPTGANTSQYKLAVKLGNLDIPEGAHIEGLWFRVVNGANFATGTLAWSTTGEFISVVDMYASGSINNTSQWLSPTVIPTREEIIGDNYLRLTFSGSSRKEVDAFQFTVEYSVPAPSGPDIRYHNGTQWAAVTEVRAHNGIQWVTIDTRLL